MTVWLQIRNDGYFLNHNTWFAYEGFSARGHVCEEFRPEQLTADLITLEPGDIVCGGVGTVHQALRKLGAEVPPPLDYPEVLRPWFGRFIEQTTWAEFWKMSYGQDFKEPLFVKPTSHKTWTGQLIREFKDLIPVGRPEPDFPVWVSNHVEFVSEWRCMILDNKIETIRNYRGDPFLVPSRRRIEKMVEAMRVCDLAAYALDVGVTQHRPEEAPWYVVDTTLLVEVNDCYALGCYGADAHLYAKMLEARWDQMVPRD